MLKTGSKPCLPQPLENHERLQGVHASLVAVNLYGFETDLIVRELRLHLGPPAMQQGWGGGEAAGLAGSPENECHSLSHRPSLA